MASKGRSACLGVVPLSNNVLATSCDATEAVEEREKRLSRSRGNVKGTEQLLRQRHREREGWLIGYNKWDSLQVGSLRLAQNA